MSNIKEMIKKVVKFYPFKHVFVISDKDSISIIIKEMSESLSLERWNQLEYVLKDLLKTDSLNIISYEQACLFYDENKIIEGEL